ncbi:MAG: two-component system, cell cycle sensor histidine kinase and response regulator CckA [Gaiellaceae bacterium]|jgi:PAS domain S-box-containing protein|nr:two-component system, cell cycle sensor histidine kinase and response regulator CckA [Gaiellaceae bacterium]
MARFDFQELVERLPLVVYVDQLDAKSSALYVSPQIAELMGYSQEEWLADPDLFASSLHPDDCERVLADIADRNAGLTGSSTVHLSYRLIARDGRVVWIRDDEIVVGDEDGRPTAAQGYMQDVSAHQQDSLRLELLVGILSLAANETDPDEVVAATAVNLAAAFGDVRVSYVERHDDGDFRIRYTTEEGEPEFWNQMEWSTAYVERLEQGGPIVVEDVAHEAWLDPVRARLVERDVVSFVDVPLLRNGKLTGVLWFNSGTARKWQKHDVSILVDVAGQLAIVLASARAREHRVRAELDLRNRDAILEAVSRSAEGFLAHPSLEDAMADLIRVLGEATGASRAYVFENVARDGSAPLATRRVHWSKSGWETMVDDSRFGHLQPAPHFPRWAELMERGEVINSILRDLPTDERETLAVVECLSIMAVPVFVEGAWWGFIGFEDCERERDWSSAETDALRAAAGLIAAAIGRDHAESDLRRRDAILEAVSHGARELVAAPSWRDAAPRFLQKLGEASAASRTYLFENGVREDGRRIASQRFEWVAAGIAPELDNPVMQDMCFEDVGLGRLAEINSRNELFMCKVRELPASERGLFADQGIKALVTVPIFVGREWWGHIGFDDCVTEREWSPAEIDALRTASSLIAAAIERERSEAILREQEQKLRAVFDMAIDAIFITNDDRRYVDVNPAACEYYGVAKRDLIGRKVEDFLPPHRSATIEEDWAAFLQGGPIRAEWETQMIDGTIQVADASARPNFLPGLHIAFFRDITERKRLEAELLNAQKLESLGRLAGGVAHDFNNLLTGITGYASLLLERTGDDAELHRDLGEIKRAADRAAELTKQLLAFGRRQVLQPRALDLNSVVTEVGALLQRLLGDHVELDILLAPALDTVRADPGQIEQVIVNLVVNARDAMPDGGKLTIRTRDADDAFVELSVSDTGLGMDELTRAQIFEPFFTTREQGAGLGLASVYGIVQQSGGDVTVESAPGQGSTFTVRLPRVLELAETPPAAPEPAPSPGSETILLVEDEDVVRELTRRVLERQGYTVLACANGMEAVALAQENDRSIDLLLTDVVMPGMRGYEVAKRVADTRPEIKILYMSGYAEEALVGRPAIAGSALIEKPFAVDALARRVRESLES